MENGSYRFAIGEASRAVGVAPGTLRVWEREGLVRPSRSKGGTRYYSKEDVERRKRIKQLKTIHRLNAAAIRRELESTHDCRSPGHVASVRPAAHRSPRGRQRAQNSAYEAGSWR